MSNITDEDVTLLLAKTPTKWDEELKKWVRDGGYIKAVEARDGSHIASKRYSKTEKKWVNRKNKSTGYIPKWEAFQKPLPNWAQPKGYIDDNRFIKVWSRCDTFDDLRKKFFWKTDKELQSAMKKIKAHCEKNGYFAPDPLEDINVTLSLEELESLCSQGYLVNMKTLVGDEWFDDDELLANDSVHASTGELRDE